MSHEGNKINCQLHAVVIEWIKFTRSLLFPFRPTWVISLIITLSY